MTSGVSGPRLGQVKSPKLASSVRTRCRADPHRNESLGAVGAGSGLAAVLALAMLGAPVRAEALC